MLCFNFVLWVWIISSVNSWVWRTMFYKYLHYQNLRLNRYSIKTMPKVEKIVNESLTWYLYGTSTGVLPVMKYYLASQSITMLGSFNDKKLFFCIKLKPTLRTSIFPQKASFPCIYFKYENEGFGPDEDSSFVFSRKSCAHSFACSTIFIPVAFQWQASGMPTTQVI